MWAAAAVTGWSSVFQSRWFNLYVDGKRSRTRRCITVKLYIQASSTEQHETESRLSDVRTLELYPYARNSGMLRLSIWIFFFVSFPLSPTDPSRHRHDLFKARRRGQSEKTKTKKKKKMGKTVAVFVDGAGLLLGWRYSFACVLWKGSEKYLRFVYSGSLSQLRHFLVIGREKKKIYKKVQQKEKEFHAVISAVYKALMFFPKKNWHAWKGRHIF